MNIFAVILILFNIAISVWLIFKITRNSQEGSSKEDEKLELKVSPLWLKVQETLITELRNEGNEELDNLLVKLETLTITPDETNRLKSLLSSQWTDREKGTRDERASAYIMSTIMDKVIIEANNKGKLVKVELVGESPKASE